MELRHLKYFVAVVECGGVTAASTALHTSQPSLGRQLRDLELHIGADLFLRDRRRYALTPAGEVFLEEARLVLALAERAVARARDAARQQGGRLLVGFDYGLEAGHTAHLMEALRGPHQGMDLVMRSQPSPQSISQVRSGQLDAAFVLLSDGIRGLACHVLQRDPIIAAISVEHPLAKKSVIAVSDLAHEPLIFASSKLAPVLYQATLAYGQRNGVHLRGAYEPESMMMAYSLVSSLKGICLLPEYTTRTFPKNVVGVPLQGDIPTVAQALVWRPDNDSAPLAAILASFNVQSAMAADD
ncbi:LysR substrate-binding domain-containing protein [Pseudomonas sp. dw_358]|uniref:LysR substrate-binding domain-containing protein n=1 Tax=Pseudomonas sp. dw_358 TaxID=2720083 RepID=UPI001BD3D758|nr:LysR substrate-binding domain-containing protein [Pseudomonas sp. dw_358]